MPLDRFVGTGVIIDARSVGARGSIGWEHFAPVVEQITPGCIIILHTGWSAHYGTTQYFENPYLDADVCRRLIDLGVRPFAIDAVAIRLA